MSLSKEDVIRYVHKLLEGRKEYTLELKGKITNGDKKVIKKALETRLEKLKSASDNRAASVVEVLSQLDKIFDTH